VGDGRWRTIQALFLAARDLPPEARAVYLSEAAPNDHELRDQVRRMLRADASDGILDRTAPTLTLTGYASDAPVEERVGPYLITAEIGRGGMGVVYRAYDPRLRRDVALKFLPGAWNQDPEAKSRLIDEARAASALDHPNTCPVYDIGSTGDGRLYIAMAYCAGGSLAGRLTSGPLPIDQAVQVAVQVAAALERAHEAGIVHRDIKPANIAFTERGDARVLDFGIAVLGTGEWAVPSTAAGTPAYMAPEQVRGEAVDRRTDVWALGAVLFEMLTGSRPFSGSRQDAIQRILEGEPPDLRSLRPQVPEALAVAVRRALAKEPAARFATAAELSMAITTAVSPAAIARSQAAPVARRSRLTHRWVLTGVAAGGIAGVAWVTLRPNASADSPALDSKAVAILPFHVHGEPSLAYLREGMVDLLAAKLTGEGGLRAADPRAVYSAWRRVVADDTDDLSRDSAVALGRRLGAAHVLLGDVVGTPASVVVNASVVNARGTVVGRASAEGAHTELPALVDRLAAQLLSASAGEDPQRLDALTSTSLPALRAYLEGQAAYRRGRYAEAVGHFGRAVDLDSTFALAGLGLSLADGWAGMGHARERGRAVAWHWRARLSQRDRALLDAHVGPAYPRPSTVRQRLAATEAALRLSPDRVELWYELGDLHYHYGRLLGIATWESQAEKALRRAVAADSTLSASIHHLIGLYARQGRTDQLRAIVTASARAAGEGATADFIRWRAGVALGGPTVDSTALDSMATETLAWIAMKTQDDGVDRRLGEHALRLRDVRPGTREERFERRLSLHAAALNGGRPEEAAALSESLRELQPDSSFHLRLRALSALYGDGDRLLGQRAVAALGAARARDARESWLNTCVRAQWRLAAGEPEPSMPPARTLRDRSADERLCDATLAAMRAVQRRDPSLRLAMDRLEDLLRSGVAEFYPGDGHLDYASIALARLREQTGDRAGALGALRYRPYFIGWQPFLAASLRDEGRLAAEVGDREGAIRAYEHYLALRHDPEPGTRAPLDSVRAELARLKAAR
jgi:serine/threonine protein kinase/tetratricopeptide (TPR) repeat protein